MNESLPIRILIADDHAMFRAGLRLVLETEKDLQVVGEAANRDRVVKLTRELKPDVLLLDLALRDQSGLEVLRELVPSSESTRAIMVTAAIDDKRQMEAIRLGARGVILKEAAAEDLIRCIRSVVAGRYWIGRDAIGGPVDAPRGSSPLQREKPGSLQPNRFGLTPRELEIVSLVIDGLSNKEIALRLNLSVDTIKHHLTNVYDKLGVSNRMELAITTIHHGLLRN